MSNKKNATLLGAISLLLLSAGGYFLVVSPILERNAETSAEIESAIASRDTAQASLATAQTYEVAYPDIAEINDELSLQFPSTADIESLNNAIVSAASQAGIPGENITSITTTSPTLIQSAETPDMIPEEGQTEGAEEGAEEVIEEPIDEIPQDVPEGEEPVFDEQVAPVSHMAKMDVSITVDGNVQALYNFIGYLQEMQRTLLITGAVLTIDEEGGTGSVSLSAISYIYVELDDPTTIDVNEGSDIQDDNASQESTDIEETEVAPTVEPGL